MKKGFTLIELLAVVVLLGILAIVVFPSVNKTIIESKEAAYKQTILSIEDAALLYITDEGLGYPTNDTALELMTIKNAGYLKDSDIINPKTNQVMDGCVIYKWLNNSYDIRYAEGSDCEIVYENLVTSTPTATDGDVPLGTTTYDNSTYDEVDDSLTFYTVAYVTSDNLGTTGYQYNINLNDLPVAVSNINSVSVVSSSVMSTIDDFNEYDRIKTSGGISETDPQYSSWFNATPNEMLASSATSSELTINSINVTCGSECVASIDASTNNLSSISLHSTTTYGGDSVDVVYLPIKFIIEISEDTSGGGSTPTAPTNVVFDNTEGVNKPQLLDGMTPIKWSGTTEQTTTESDIDWYDYSNKKWANAKTEDGSYWVWVPRYAYMIGNGYHTSTANEISIKFLKDDTTDNVNDTTILTSGYVADETDTSDNYFLHPAFENADTKYGFWVAKYEASGTSNDIAITYGVSSLRSMTIGDMFNAAKGMGTNENYGWNTSETETHMMTNYEWGAVAYLTQSEYGRCESGTCTEVTINDNSSYYTGGGTGDAYKTNVGQSTTGNVTGVYDMSGGAWEYVVAYVNNENSNITTYGTSIVNSTSDYKNVYTVTSDSRANNYEANKNIYGDAVYEISSSYEGSTSWNGDYSHMPYSSSPWFLRGGCYSGGAYAGVFHFGYISGSAFSYDGFRPVVSRAQS